MITIHAMNLMTSFHGVELVADLWPIGAALVGAVLVGLGILIASARRARGGPSPLPPSADAMPCAPARHAA
jgi:hypothetical protein